MTKQEFVEKVAGKTQLSKSAVRMAVDAAFSTIMESVKEGDKISFPGFGTFVSLQRKQQQRYNPLLGRHITVPAMSVPKFRPGKRFKRALAKRK